MKKQIYVFVLFFTVMLGLNGCGAGEMKCCQDVVDDNVEIGSPSGEPVVVIKTNNPPVIDIPDDENLTEYDSYTLIGPEIDNWDNNTTFPEAIVLGDDVNVSLSFLHYTKHIVNRITIESDEDIINWLKQIEIKELNLPLFNFEQLNNPNIVSVDWEYVDADGDTKIAPDWQSTEDVWYDLRRDLFKYYHTDLTDEEKREILDNFYHSKWVIHYENGKEMKVSPFNF